VALPRPRKITVGLEAPHPAIEGATGATSSGGATSGPSSTEREVHMANTTPTHEGPLSTLIDQQLELAAARLPALRPGDVHPSPEDHEEVTAAHATFEDVLLGNAEPPAEMLEELAALEAAPPLTEDELAQQALSERTPDEPAPPTR
jgi:hypothetical protein